MVVKTCSHCGKEFVPAPQHLYKAKSKYQCSYTCYRAEGGDSAKKKPKRRRVY